MNDKFCTEKEQVVCHCLGKKCHLDPRADHGVDPHQRVLTVECSRDATICSGLTYLHLLNSSLVDSGHSGLSEGHQQEQSNGH